MVVINRSLKVPGSGNTIDVTPLHENLAIYNNLLNGEYKGVYLKNLADNNWKSIQSASKEISDNQYTSEQVYEKYGWSIGDQKPFVTLSGEQCVATIIGFNHDIDFNNEKVGITFEFEYLLASKYALHSSSDNTGGWPDCQFNVNTSFTLLATLPEDLQAVIHPVMKKCANGDSNTGTTIVEDQNHLFLPSAIEISLGSDSKMYNYSGEGSVYEAYQKGRSKIKYQYGSTSAITWFTRTPCAGMLSFKYYATVSASGVKSTSAANSSQGILLMFCV